MNFGFHIFGNPQGHFCQFPNDETSTRNVAVASDSSVRTLYIERDGCVMTYIYCQHFESGCYIGFRIALNSMQFGRPKALGTLLSRMIDNMLAQGSVLRCASTGSVEYGIDDFATCAAEVEISRQYVEFQLTTYPYQFKCEPLKGFPMFKEVLRIPFTEKNVDIEAKTYEYERICIYSETYSRGGDLPALVQSLGKDLKASREECSQKAEEIINLRHQKKQFKVVIGLMLLLLGAVFGLYSLKGNLDSAKGELSSASARIRADSVRIEGLRSSLDVANEELNRKNSKLEQIKKAAENIHSTFYLPNWYSSNHAHNSRSEKTYYFYAYPGDELAFDYYVDSEGPDHLHYQISGPNKNISDYYSGNSTSGNKNIELDAEGIYTLNLSYTKDGSVNRGSDYGCFTNIRLVRSGIQEIIDVFAPQIF